jgi:hypothetical protein
MRAKARLSGLYTMYLAFVLKPIVVNEKSPNLKKAAKAAQIRQSSHQPGHSFTAGLAHPWVLHI